jgi:hypothetical protein
MLFWVQGALLAGKKLIIKSLKPISMKTMIKTKPSFGKVMALPVALLVCAHAHAGSIVTQASAPTVGAYDIAQLVTPNSDTLNINGPGQTYTGNNDGSTFVANDRNISQGQLFTTGLSAVGFNLTDIWVQNVFYTDAMNNGTWAGLNVGNSITLRIVDPSQANSAGFVMASQVCTVTAGSGFSGGTGTAPYYSGSGLWLHMTLDTPLALAANTQYGFDLTSYGPYFELAGMDANQYSGGSAYTTGTKEALNTGTVYGGDRTFVANLQVIPEPSTLALLGLGGMAVLLRRKSKA